MRGSRTWELPWTFLTLKVGLEFSETIIIYPLLPNKSVCPQAPTFDINKTPSNLKILWLVALEQYFFPNILFFPRVLNLSITDLQPKAPFTTLFLWRETIWKFQRANAQILCGTHCFYVGNGQYLWNECSKQEQSFQQEHAETERPH